jgi:hypothetical protein
MNDNDILMRRNLLKETFEKYSYKVILNNLKDAKQIESYLKKEHAFNLFNECGFIGDRFTYANFQLEFDEISKHDKTRLDFNEFILFLEKLSIILNIHPIRLYHTLLDCPTNVNILVESSKDDNLLNNLSNKEIIYNNPNKFIFNEIKKDLNNMNCSKTTLMKEKSILDNLFGYMKQQVDEKWKVKLNNDQNNRLRKVFQNYAKKKIEDNNNSNNGSTSSIIKRLPHLNNNTTGLKNTNKILLNNKNNDEDLDENNRWLSLNNCLYWLKRAKIIDQNYSKGFFDKNFMEVVGELRVGNEDIKKRKINYQGFLYLLSLISEKKRIYPIDLLNQLLEGPKDYRSKIRRKS